MLFEDDQQRNYAGTICSDIRAAAAVTLFLSFLSVPSGYCFMFS